MTLLLGCFVCVDLGHRKIRGILVESTSNRDGDPIVHVLVPSGPCTKDEGYPPGKVFSHLIRGGDPALEVIKTLDDPDAGGQ